MLQTSVQRIMDLFRGSDTWHGTHGEPDLDDNGVKWTIKRTAKTLRGQPTLEMWKAHLDGKKPLGVVTIRDDSTCYHGSIDVDEYDVDALDVIKKIEAAKLPLVPCRSKSGGLHLFMFFTEPQPAETVQSLLRSIAANIGFSGSEIFPKQTKIFVDKGDHGSWMVMPYYGGDFGGKLRFQYGLKKSGAEMTLEEFVGFAEKRRATEADIAEIRTQLIKPKRTSKEREPFSDGPPCLQIMARSGFPDGGRNNALFHIGVYLRRAHPDSWQKKLEDDNIAHMKPPLPMEEVQSIVRSLQKKDYEYKCKDQPMARHCDSGKCRGRKFGVGDGEAYPTIEGMKKLDTEPELFFVDIPGAHIMCTVDQLTNYRRFHNLCVAKSNICFRIISDHVWNGILGEAMKSMTIIEAPPETRRDGMFRALVFRFLSNRAMGEKKEDLLREVPWEDEENERYVFSLDAFLKFLKRENNKEFAANEVTHRLKEDVGAEKIVMDVQGRRNQRFWTVSTKNVEKAAQLEPPDKEKEII